jgi:hypothetical protein
MEQLMATSSDFPIKLPIKKPKIPGSTAVRIESTKS